MVRLIGIEPTTSPLGGERSILLSYKRIFLAERVGFEPTCPFEATLISSQARYDHFDTTPFLFLCDLMFFGLHDMQPLLLVLPIKYYAFNWFTSSSTSMPCTAHASSSVSA